MLMINEKLAREEMVREMMADEVEEDAKFEEDSESKN